MICKHCIYQHGKQVLLTRVNENAPLDLWRPAWSCPCCNYQASIDIRTLQEPGEHTRPDELRPRPCGQQPDQPGGNR